MGDVPATDTTSVVVIVLGPAVVLALAAALVYWLRARKPPKSPH